MVVLQTSLYVVQEEWAFQCPAVQKHRLQWSSTHPVHRRPWPQSVLRPVYQVNRLVTTKPVPRTCAIRETHRFIGIGQANPTATSGCLRLRFLSWFWHGTGARFRQSLTGRRTRWAAL